MVSRLAFLLLVTDHFPPFAHSGSSHFGSIPVLNKWKSAFIGNRLGLNICSYKLKKEKNQPNDQEHITRLNIKMNQTQLPISFLENVYDLTTIETN